jgi:micrococcal nuclease
LFKRSAVHEAPPSRPPRSTKLRISSLSTSVTLALALVACSSPEPSQGAETTAKLERQATVQTVADGDTLVLDIGGAAREIRLAGLQAPDLRGVPDVSCLGSDARALLAELAPVGSVVTVPEAPAAAGLTELTVTNAQGTNLSPAIAAAGLGIASPNEGTNASAEVSVAQAAAKDAGLGLYSDEVDCTVAGRVRLLVGDSGDSDSETTTTSTTPTTTAPAPPAIITVSEAEEASTAALALLRTATTLEATFDGSRRGVVWLAHTAASLTQFRSAVANEVKIRTVVYRDAEAVRASALAAEAARIAEEQRLAAEAEAARIAEEQRLAAEAEAARIAEEQRLAVEAEAARIAEQKRLAAEAARIAEEKRLAAEAQAASAAKSAASPRNAPTPNSGSSGSTGYTGPRCYAPGGKTWKPC